MCNYCGCRSTPALARLTAEHERMLNARGELSRAVARGDLNAAVEQLQVLTRLLGPHNRIEELVLYPALLAVDGYQERVSRMYDEHDEIDVVLEQARGAATSRPEAVNWDRVQAATHLLAMHIDAEEHGLFPAAAVSLDPEVWDRADALVSAREDDLLVS
jgi:hemerythrin-like domain-containing protein